MEYFLQTFGCNMNHTDSARLKTVLEKLSFKETLDKYEADLIIFNTCSVRQKAEDRVIGFIHNLKESKAKIGITGCMVRKTGIKGKNNDKLFNKIPRLDFVFRIEDLSEFPNLIQKLFPTISTPVPESASGGTVQGTASSTYFSISQQPKNTFSVFIPIMTGCDNFCSYCVVPYSRGREKSRTAKEILEEINCFVKKGAIEITLLGQNVNSYKCSETGKDFTELLIEANKIKELKRIRYNASHPKDFSDKLIKTLPKLKKVCEHIHLPIQAGDNEILKKMNRNYTREDYLRLVKKIKKYNPFAVITTDIIVGFPGETKKQFENTVDLVKKLKFPLIFISQYSSRRGTKAYKMKDDVSVEEKERRWYALNDLLREFSYKENKKIEGKTVEILIDSLRKGYYYGKTRTNREIRFKSRGKDLLGKLVKVRCVEAKDFFVEGRI